MPEEPIIRPEFFPHPTENDVVQPYYVREITLECYGQGHPFGTYDRETGELTISDLKAMGDLRVEWVKSYCEQGHRANNIGSHVLFGVPRKVYELRERAKYAYPEDYL